MNRKVTRFGDLKNQVNFRAAQYITLQFFARYFKITNGLISREMVFCRAFYYDDADLVIGAMNNGFANIDVFFGLGRKNGVF